MMASGGQKYFICPTWNPRQADRNRRCYAGESTRGELLPEFLLHATKVTLSWLYCSQHRRRYAGMAFAPSGQTYEEAIRCTHFCLTRPPHLHALDPLRHQDVARVQGCVDLRYEDRLPEGLALRHLSSEPGRVIFVFRFFEREHRGERFHGLLSFVLAKNRTDVAAFRDTVTDKIEHMAGAGMP